MLLLCVLIILFIYTKLNPKYSRAPAFAGSCAYGAQVTLTAALRLVEASPATAMSYLTVVWGLILGYFFFSEVWSPWFTDDQRNSLTTNSLVYCTHAVSGFNPR